eukprot:COSAG05_NODE_345_length_10977_cov_17.229178_4_plen_78_part_00
MREFACACGRELVLDCSQSTASRDNLARVPYDSKMLPIHQTIVTSRPSSRLCEVPSRVFHHMHQALQTTTFSRQYRL